MSTNQNQEMAESRKRFDESMAHWGGWPKLVSGDSLAFIKPVSKTIAEIGEHQKASPLRVGSLTTEEWTPIAEVFPSFLNAYLQQELNRILDGPHDFLTAIRLVQGSWAGKLLMALVIVAREHYLHVEVSYKSPHGQGESICQLSGRNGMATLTIMIAKEHGEVSLPLLLHYCGKEELLDKDESTPETPVYAPIAVNKKLVVFCDGSDYGDSTLQQRQRNDFLRGQGFQTIQFPPMLLGNDLFGCAAETIKLISSRTFPPPEHLS